jgi:uncharacterized Zn finger protein
MLAIAPLRIYNTADKDPMKKRVNPRKLRYVINKPDATIDADELHHLREQIAKYKRGQAKLKRLARWNLRSTKSSLRDVQETLETLEDLYGDLAFDDDEDEWHDK